MDRCIPETNTHFFSDKGKSCLCGAEVAHKSCQLAEQLRKLAGYDPANEPHGKHNSAQQVEPVDRVL